MQYLRYGQHREGSMSVGVLHRCGEIRVIRLEDRTDVTDFAAEHAYDLESEDGIVFQTRDD